MPYDINSLQTLVPPESYKSIEAILSLSQWIFWSSLICFIIGLGLIYYKNENYKKWLFLGSIFPPIMLVLFVVPKKEKPIPRELRELNEVENEIRALEAKARYLRSEKKDSLSPRTPLDFSNKPSSEDTNGSC